MSRTTQHKLGTICNTCNTITPQNDGLQKRHSVFSLLFENDPASTRAAIKVFIISFAVPPRKTENSVLKEEEKAQQTRFI
jgi:hypothetical protein